MAGRNKHYLVLAVRSISHITLIKRLKAKIPVRTTRVDLRNERLLKCVYNTRCGVQVPTSKHSPCSQTNISYLLGRHTVRKTFLMHHTVGGKRHLRSVHISRNPQPHTSLQSQRQIPTAFLPAEPPRQRCAASKPPHTSGSHPMETRKLLSLIRAGLYHRAHAPEPPECEPRPTCRRKRRELPPKRSPWPTRTRQ